MFEGLRGALSGVARSITEKQIDGADVDAVMSELDVALLEADVAVDVIDMIKADMREALAGSSVRRGEVGQFVRSRLAEYVSRAFEGAGAVDIAAMARAKRGSGSPLVVVFVGINGTGKTTTLAKVAHALASSGITLAVAAADTFRSGAIEQLRAHTDALGIKLVAQNYGSDPAAVARDAILYARSHGVDCVLVDTAGRMQTNRNLMDQVSKIVAVASPDLKVFVGDSLAGNDTASQAREFHERVGVDAAIVTKADGGGGGGAALSIAKLTSAPIAYAGTGQGYGDLEPFDAGALVGSMLGAAGAREQDARGGGA